MRGYPPRGLPASMAGMPPIALRLRAASPGLLSLPWLQPLGDWTPDTVPLRQIQVGPSRHLVRFVEADGPCTR